jgi:hypothetical protein
MMPVRPTRRWRRSDENNKWFSLKYKYSGIFIKLFCHI